MPKWLLVDVTKSFVGILKRLYIKVVNMYAMHSHSHSSQVCWSRGVVVGPTSTVTPLQSRFEIGIVKPEIKQEN